MKTARRQQGKGAFDLIEEATHQLRTAAPATLAVYYAGAVPFVLGLLYFWADMSQSPFAGQHVAEFALTVGALFLWMKFCQAVFARRMRAQITAKSPEPLSWPNALRIAAAQTILQPPGLFLIPLALVPVLSFGWVYAFFQNASALAAEDAGSVKSLFKKSWQQATLWSRQNHLVLAILSAFVLIVFLNWTTFCLMLPFLFKTLFGVESAFSKSALAMLNTTFFAGMFGLTYLCVDPLLKTIYVLRCFYGESLASGEDLKAELKVSSLSQTKPVALLLVLLATLAWGQVKADSVSAAVPPAVPGQISPEELDRSIVQTIHEQKYTWRLPRGETVKPDSRDGILVRFFDKVGDLLRKWIHATLDWLEKLLRKLFPHRQTSVNSGDSSGYGWIMSVEILLYALVAAAIAALLIFLYRVWRRRHKAPVVAAEAVLPVPDLTDENIRADQLPEDGWTKLARELLERGEFRLAMRAFYLASLAHLAANNLVSLARFKSNRDYERELRRRAHTFPNLIAAFGENVFAFERIWYGTHEASPELVGQFAVNVEKIKAGG